MKLNKKEVAQNLRLFGYKRYGTMKKFAEALDMNPSTLYSGYLNGRSLPGPVLLVKLIDLGCNVNWLLTSRETPFTNDQQGSAHIVEPAVAHRTIVLHTPAAASKYGAAKSQTVRFAEGHR
jgi:hypothetical protein